MKLTLTTSMFLLCVLAHLSSLPTSRYGSEPSHPASTQLPWSCRLISTPLLPLRLPSYCRFYRRLRRFSSFRHSSFLLLLLLLLCGNVERNPGPPQATSIKCVCANAKEEGNMLECEICHSWSHCKCVKISASLASTYPFVCAFCIKSSLVSLSSLHSKIKSSFATLSFLSCKLSTLECNLLRLSQKLDSITAPSLTSSAPTSIPVSNAIPSLASLASLACPSVVSCCTSPSRPPMSSSKAVSSSSLLTQVFSEWSWSGVEFSSELLLCIARHSYLLWAVVFCRLFSSVVCFLSLRFLSSSWICCISRTFPEHFLSALRSSMYTSTCYRISQIRVHPVFSCIQVVGITIAVLKMVDFIDNKKSWKS